MMIGHLLFFSLVFAAAPEEPSLRQAQKVWKHFRTCPQKTSRDVSECASEYIATKLVPPERSKMLQFLDMGIEFSALSVCDESSPVVPNRLQKKEAVYCMQLSGLKKETHGYVIFVKEGETTKIQTIKFKL